MHSTKTEILTLLKRNDGATVDELASALGLASMTVRQHLTALERDALVHADEVRRATGRPHFRFRLTDEGNRQVSAGYDRLVALLVDRAGHFEPNGHGPDDRRKMLFRAAAEELAARHRTEIGALAGIAQVERIAAILRSHGGFTEWHELPEGAELRDFNCVYRASVSTNGACEWHETFLSAIINTPVAAAPQDDACAACCRYIIPLAAHAVRRESS